MATGFDSAGVALQTLKSNPLNTLLSTLGIVVGIAALVGILSFGDGMEQFAREQIMRNTDFQSILVSTRTTQVVDGVSIPRPYPDLTVEDIGALGRALQDSADVTMVKRLGVAVSIRDSLAGDTLSSGSMLYATIPSFLDIAGGHIATGRFLTDSDVAAEASVIVVSDSLARRLARSEPVSSLVGKSIYVGDKLATVIGVTEKQEQGGTLAGIMPITAEAANRDARPPLVTIRATRIEDVPLIAARVRVLLDDRFGEEASAFDIQTNAGRVEQVARGVLLFKIVMGLIVGLSVLVGGIGVMNVLLMSVTERTREIGIRKAAGARRRDIVMQFLLESVAISAIGCIAGLAFGAIVVFGASPIIRKVTDMPFDAILSASTVFVVASAAVVLGLTFGTYPAWRASRLSPVDAIRHE